MGASISIYLLVVLGSIIFKVWWDVKERKKGRIINHALSAIYHIILYVSLDIYLFGWDSGPWTTMALLIRWTLFDLLYNKATGKRPFYCGKISKLDKIADALDGRVDSECKLAFFLKLLLIILNLIFIIWNP